MKRNFGKKILAALMICIGFGIILYPLITNYFGGKSDSLEILRYNAAVEKLNDKECASLLRKAREYNRILAENAGKVTDPFGKEEGTNESYEELLDITGSGMMGYLVIPKLEIELPIYYGTSEEVLKKAVGHVKNTSLPVGGKRSHSVLAGHRGLPTRDIFTDLDFLVEGDVFYIRVLKETLTYRVNQLLTVLPEETEALQIVEDKDYVTLFTCTPYGVNSHRLLVRGERIPYDGAENLDVKGGLKIPRKFQVALGVLALLVLWAVFHKNRRKNR